MAYRGASNATDAIITSKCQADLCEAVIIYLAPSFLDKCKFRSFPFESTPKVFTGIADFYLKTSN